MVNQFIHSVNNSFKLFLEHEILQKGESYRNNSGQLYYSQDARMPNSGTYANPYGQFVYDSSISGANIITGAYIGNTFLTQGQSGMVIDYNGRIILPFKTNQTVTASYAVKDFNIYSTAKSEDKLIYNTKLKFRPKYNVPKSGLPPVGEIAPCIYLKQTNSRNEPFAFAGQDNSIYNFRAIVMADNEYMLDGIGGIFQDLNDRVCQILPTNPFNRYGGLVSGTYNYSNDVNDNQDPNQYLYIESSFDRFDTDIENELDLNIYLGIADFSLSIARFPRVF
jgi:hypothetical protein